MASSQHWQHHGSRHRCTFQGIPFARSFPKWTIPALPHLGPSATHTASRFLTLPSLTYSSLSIPYFRGILFVRPFPKWDNTRPSAFGLPALPTASRFLALLSFTHSSLSIHCFFTLLSCYVRVTLAWRLPFCIGLPAVPHCFVFPIFTALFTPLFEFYFVVIPIMSLQLTSAHFCLCMDIENQVASNYKRNHILVV